MIQQLVQTNSELTHNLHQESATFKQLEDYHIKLTHSFHDCTNQVNIKQQQIEGLQKSLTAVQDEVCA